MVRLTATAVMSQMALVSDTQVQSVGSRNGTLPGNLLSRGSLVFAVQGQSRDNNSSKSTLHSLEDGELRITDRDRRRPRDMKEHH